MAKTHKKFDYLEENPNPKLNFFLVKSTRGGMEFWGKGKMGVCKFRSRDREKIRGKEREKENPLSCL